jgi:beta-1,4-mannosyl-glycoprotein beta-1,4-N-acetylglucosaminyltransferase
LSEVVDLFIISESKYTFSGKRKELYLTENLSQLGEYSKKIVIVKNTRKHLTLIPWTREHRQRQLITKYLKKIKLNCSDLIIHSDCDEIPRYDVIKSLHNRNVPIDCIFELDNYQYYINLFSGKWKRGRVISGDLYKSINKMHKDIFIENMFNKRRHKFPILRLPVYATDRYYFLWYLPEVLFKAKSLEVVRNAGWHFNNLFSEKQLITKVQSSSHTEYNNDNFKSIILKRRRNGQDMFSGDKLNIVDIDDSFPRDIKENIEYWKGFIFRPDS